MKKYAFAADPDLDSPDYPIVTAFIPMQCTVNICKFSSISFDSFLLNY